MSDYIFKPSANAAGDFTNGVEFEGFDPGESVAVADGTYDIYQKVVSAFVVAQIGADLSVTEVGGEPVITATDGAISVSIDSGPYAGSYTQRVTDGAPLSVAMIEAAPTPIILPVITGTTSEGATLTAVPGIWLYAGADPGDQSFAWQNDSDGPLGVTEIGYTLQASDIGDTIRIEETFAGLTISSAPTSLVTVGAAVPEAFGAEDWSVATGSGANELDITITSLPNDGGSTITDIEYDIDGAGAWTSLGTAATGSTILTMAAAGAAYAIRLRAINGIGAGAPGNSESALSGATAPAAATPADYVETLHWWSFKIAEGGLYQDGGKTTPVDTAGQNIRAVADQVGSVDLLNATGDNTYGAGDEAILSGTNNAIFTTSASLSLPNPCIILTTLKTSDTAFCLISKNNSAFAAVSVAGSGAGPDASFGAPVYYSGTTQVTPDTRAALSSSWATDIWNVVSARNLNFGAAAACDFFDYSNTGLATSGQVKDMVIVDASISANDLDALIADMAMRA